MRIPDVLIILGCLGAGYWIVSSIMGPGIDVMRAGREVESGRKTMGAKQDADPDALAQPVPDWHIVLDIPRDASLRDIEAARKRRLAAAAHADDRAAATRIQQAADWAMRQKR